MQSDEGLEEAVRRALGSTYSTYKEFKVVSKWASNHAHFYHILLRRTDIRRCHLVVKHYISVGPGHSDLYTLMNSPQVLFPKESTNLGTLDKHVIDSLRRPRKLTPRLMGMSNPDFMLVMDYLPGTNHRERIVKAAANGEEALAETLLEGIKVIARFNGLCNYHKADINKAFDYKQSTEVDFAICSRRAQFKENLARVFYSNYPELREAIGPFDYDQVNEYLSTKRGISINQKVESIGSSRSGLKERQNLQHNDCNGLNLIGRQVIDLESFGYGPWTGDISSYCVIVGLGHNPVFRSYLFNHFRHVYLAYTHAWEKKDSDALSRLDRCQNGEFRKYVGETMTEREYADWTMSFFGRAIEKTLKLGAIYDRNNPSETNGTSVATQPNINGYLHELFLTVHGLGPLINRCTEPEQVRDYFYTLGKVMQEVGYSISDEMLYGIRTKTISDGVLEEIPKFK